MAFCKWLVCPKTPRPMVRLKDWYTASRKWLTSQGVLSTTRLDRFLLAYWSAPHATPDWAEPRSSAPMTQRQDKVRPNESWQACSSPTTVKWSRFVNHDQHVWVRNYCRGQNGCVAMSSRELSELVQSCTEVRWNRLNIILTLQTKRYSKTFYPRIFF